ncbi:MAG: transglutaminase-like domain-containing protein [Alphaproteobacteria bacterium]|nr:transglutaminase-like domain-containing protein [Alphaproteobacteria bacterium]
MSKTPPKDAAAKVTAAKKSASKKSSATKARAAPSSEVWAEDMLQALARQEDGAFDIIEGALALAAFDSPSDRLVFYREHLTTMVQDVADAISKADSDSVDAMQRLTVINQVLFGLHGYSGDTETYDDLQNANIIRVIDRRRGLPVALGILMMHLARAQGWEMRGLDFPGHFLLRFECEGERIIVDPFHGGVSLDAPALRALLKATAGNDAELQSHHYEAVSDRDVLLRLQNNIKLRLIKDQRVEEAVHIVESMLLLAPDRATLWRESGLMNAHIGKVRTAIAAFETYLQKETRDSSRREVATLVNELRSSLN